MKFFIVLVIICVAIGACTHNLSLSTKSKVEAMLAEEFGVLSEELAIDSMKEAAIGDLRDELDVYGKSNVFYIPNSEHVDTAEPLLYELTDKTKILVLEIQIDREFADKAYLQFIWMKFDESGILMSRGFKERLIFGE